MALQPGLAALPRLFGLALLLLAWLASPALAWDGARTLITLERVSLRAPGAGDLPPSPAYSAFRHLEPAYQGHWVELPQGGRALLESQEVAILPGPPGRHAERLARLASAPLESDTARRLARGLLEAGDSPWLVELAWGRPARSFMVNRFQDEEHYVYGQPGQSPLLLRFKGGRLSELPAQELNPAWLETPPAPR